DVFAKVMAMSKAGKIKIGQLIHEYGSGKDWIHVSNDPHIIYSDEVCKEFLTREKYLTSPDDGVNYVPAV
ncbi:MAG: hypothetical protein ABFD50_21980, partial [Smithella sp.]